MIVMMRKCKRLIAEVAILIVLVYVVVMVSFIAMSAKQIEMGFGSYHLSIASEVFTNNFSILFCYS
jgi:hypothetical protein